HHLFWIAIMAILAKFNHWYLSDFGANLLRDLVMVTRTVADCTVPLIKFHLVSADALRHLGNFISHRHRYGYFVPGFDLLLRFLAFCRRRRCDCTQVAADLRFLLFLIHLTEAGTVSRITHDLLHH